MRNKINKYILRFLVVVFLFISFSSIIFAVNYGVGLYGASIYSATPPGTSVASPVAGLYNTTQSVVLTEPNSISIRYSVTGMPASCSSDTEYSIPISISSTQTIYVRACDTYGNSSTTSFTYTIDTIPPETPIATPPAGLYNSTQSVALSAVGSNYIKYSLVSTPATCGVGTPYEGLISVSTSQTIYVRACDDAGNSSTESFAYTIDTTEPLTPVATPSSSIYNSTQSVTLSATDSDYIKYSLTETPLTCSDGTLYSDLIPITVSESQTIYVRACDNAGNSSTTSFTYTIDTIPPETPIATPPAGLYNSTQSVALSAVGSNYIKYSLVSTPATCGVGTPYEGLISVSTSQTIYVRACDDAGNSSTESFTYTIDTEAPEIPIATPSTGLYNSTQSVTLSATGSDYIKYGESLPSSCSEGTLSEGPISISSSQTIYVRACDDAGNSSITSFAYVIDTEAPSTVIASPIAGKYSSTQSVTLIAEGSDIIQYSTTEIPTTCSSDTLYTEPIPISSSVTIYARACDNLGNSSITNFTYIISNKSHSMSIGSTLAYRTNFIEQQQVINTITTTPIILNTPVPTFIFTKTLKQNTTDPEVKELQKYLNSKGYIVAKTGIGSIGQETNYFGSLTEQALMAFQKANNLTPDGIVGPNTLALLNNTSTVTIPTVTLVTNPQTIRTLRQGMRGDDVLALQTYLKAKGFDSGTPDGSFGPKTKSAVIAFQKANNLTPDGVVGPNTVKFMNDSQSTPSIPAPLKTRTLKLSAPRMIGDDIKTLQTYLNEKGYDVGTPDGILGNKTKSAIMAFQTANSLTPDGIVGAKTLDMMK